MLDPTEDSVSDFERLLEGSPLPSGVVGQDVNQFANPKPDYEVFYSNGALRFNPYSSGKKLEMPKGATQQGLNVWHRENKHQTGRVGVWNGREYHEEIFSGLISPVITDGTYEDVENGASLGELTDSNRVLFSTEGELRTLVRAREELENSDYSIRIERTDGGHSSEIPDSGPLLEAKYRDGQVILGPMDSSLELDLGNNQEMEIPSENSRGGLIVASTYETADKLKYVPRLPSTESPYPTDI
jgi:hypothetical protein